MNAQEMLLDYAKSHNNSNLTDQQFIGQAINEGIRIADNAHGDRMSVRITREGKTIVVTETTKMDTPNGKEQITNEIFRVNI